MEHTTANIVCVPVPCDDGSIERALADLESKLTALTHGLREAQAAVRDMAARQVERAPEAPEDGQPSCVSDAAVSQSVEPASSEMDATTEFATEAEATAETHEEVTGASDEDVSPPAAPEAVDEMAADAGLDAMAMPMDMGAAEAQPPEPSEDDDEAMLATLDEETANAIRVMRRMSLGKKTVRELLEKYQTSRPNQRAGSRPKKQSWWR